GLAVNIQPMLVLLNNGQPVARLAGGLRGGLRPWRRHGPKAGPMFRPATMRMWRDKREPAEATLSRLEHKSQAIGLLVRSGGDFDSWDLEIRQGIFGGVRMLLAVEEHAPGKQLLRFKLSQTYSKLALAFSAVFA